MSVSGTAGTAADCGRIAGGFANFADRLRYDDIPAPIIARAKLHMLDAIGVALAASAYGFGHAAVAALLALDSGGFEVIGMRERLPLRDAVLVNGMLVHGIDFDDSHAEGRVHASAANFPCALGVAAYLARDGRDLLTAYLLGMEATIRIGMAARGGFQAAGWHPTGVVGTFGCALSAGKLLGLRGTQFVMAQGIAYSTAAGTREFVPEAAWTKRMHAGWAGVGGITAALLARRGCTGPSTAYEGAQGLYRTYLDKPASPEALTAILSGLGERWEIERTSIKPLPACHFSIAHIECAIALAHEHGIRSEDVESIRALVPEAALAIVCEPKAAKKRPADAYAALFSIYYGIASAFVRGRFTLDDVEPDALRDARVLALADKVEYELDPHTTFPRHYSGGVVIRLKDGREVSARQDVNRGSVECPLSSREVLEKFFNNATRAVPREKAQTICDLVLALDEGVNAATLSRSLAVGT